MKRLVVKKRCYIVYAHPEPKSFVAAMRNAVEDTLRDEGWNVDVCDLYAKKFEPVASASDFHRRASPDYLTYALEQRAASSSGDLAADIKEEVDFVLEADLLVLVFPVFWFSLPAILKGWIDRVFLSGVFYGGRRIYDRGPMVGKQALVVTSLGGRDHMFGPMSIHGDVTSMLRPLLQGSLAYVGYDVYDPFVAYHVPYVSQETRAGYLQCLKLCTRNLDTRAILQMPSLEDFDDQLAPIGRG